MNGRIDLRQIQDPFSLGFDTRLDLSNSEKKFTVTASSHVPRLREVRIPPSTFKKPFLVKILSLVFVYVQINLETTWEKESDFIKARADLRTPFQLWEVQHISTFWERKDETLNTFDFELFSEEYGKLGTRVGVGPLQFSIILNTPLQGFT